MKKTHLFSKGFTLIELLVVIAIIALLTGIVMANLSGPKAKARDSKRISDLGQIQLALELYFDRCKVYPVTTDLSDDSATECTTSSGDVLTYKTFLPQIPVAPAPGSYTYYPSADGSDYRLKATLEYASTATQDGNHDSEFGDYNPKCDETLSYCLAPK